ncbi:MAG: CDP-diacylglycerol--serine O-phosphatidyltransferase [Mariprofundaceae bacterium]
MGKALSTLRAKGVYVLPSMFTTAGLFAGFYALIAAIQSHFEIAAWALIIAIVFDVLDGRVARLLHAESKFGAEYDSLCDMVSFGIAPAVLVYMWALTPLHKPGWLAAFLIAACAALRLARFNTEHDNDDIRFFQGLPTPAAAAMIATSVLLYEDQGAEPSSWLWFIVSVLLAYLMVSRVRFFAAKNVDLKRQRPFAFIIIMIAVFVLIVANPHLNLFLIALAYCLSGPILSLRQHQKLTSQRLAQRLRRKEKDPPPQDPPQD